MSYLTRMLVVAALLFTISPACAEEAVSPLVSKAIDAIGRTGLEHLTTMMVRGMIMLWGGSIRCTRPAATGTTAIAVLVVNYAGMFPLAS